jgi:hypothetical protein
MCSWTTSRIGPSGRTITLNLFKDERRREESDVCSFFVDWRVSR